jgi:hypothetical protein
MTQIDRSHPHTTAVDRARRRSTRAALRSGQGPSARRLSDAVVASYLHDISQRHRTDGLAPLAPAARR